MYWLDHTAIQLVQYKQVKQYYNHMHVYKHKQDYQHGISTTHFTCLKYHWSSQGTQTQAVSAPAWYLIPVSLLKRDNLIP